MWHRGKSRCESGACAEAARNGDVVLLRSTLNPDATLALRHDELGSATGRYEGGDFDNV